MAAYAAANLGLNITGNFLSIVFPVKRPISSLMNSPSQVALVVSFGLVFGAAGAVAGLLVLARILGGPVFETALLVAAVLLLAGLYALLLPVAGRLLQARQEALIATLTGAEG